MILNTRCNGVSRCNPRTLGEGGDPNHPPPHLTLIGEAADPNKSVFYLILNTRCNGVSRCNPHTSTCFNEFSHVRPSCVGGARCWSGACGWNRGSGAWGRIRSGRATEGVTHHAPHRRRRPLWRGALHGLPLRLAFYLILNSRCNGVSRCNPRKLGEGGGPNHPTPT